MNIATDRFQMMVKLSFYVTIYLTHSALMLGDFAKKFHQNDYKIKVDRVVVLSIDATYFELFDFRSYKYNRTQLVLNMTLKFRRDEEDLQIIHQFYKLSNNNDYRIFPAMRYYLSLCEIIESDLYGFGTAFRKDNRDPGCPFKKNIIYHTGNAIIDEKRSPPFVPTGEFKQELTAIYLDKNVATVEFYFTIYRPILPKD